MDMNLGELIVAVFLQGIGNAIGWVVGWAGQHPWQAALTVAAAVGLAILGARPRRRRRRSW